MPPPSSPNDRLSRVRFNVNSLNLISQYLNHNSNLSIVDIPLQLRNISMDTDDDYEVVNDDDADEDVDDDDIVEDIEDEDEDDDNDIADDSEPAMNPAGSFDTDIETLFPTMSAADDGESDDSDDSSSLNLHNMLYNDFPFSTEIENSWHVNSPETVLLSSARYRHHYPIVPRRYPSSHYQRLHLNNPVNTSTTHLPIPLARSNAIRRKPNLPDSDSRSLDERRAKPFLDGEAASLKAQIETIMSTLNLSEYELSPLFIMKKFRKRRRNLDSKDNLFLNLEDFMDDFLRLRKKDNIWAIPKVSRKVRKRKRKSGDSGNFKSNKKQKLCNRDDSNRDIDVSFHAGRSLFSNLTVNQKNAILDIQYCSIFTSGNSYSLNLPKESSPICDLVFTNINYTTKSIDGIFDVCGHTHKQVFKNLIKFKQFLYGNVTSSNYNLPKQNYMFRKMNVLGRLVSDSRIRQTIGIIPGRPKQVNLAVSGSMIDFKERDLRFLNRSNKSEGHKIKTFHSSRLKSNGVRIQLSEWMRIQPFIQFKQSFFLTYINRLGEILRNFSSWKATSTIKQMMLQRAISFVQSMGSLISDINLCEPGLRKYRETFHSSSRQERDYFLDEWKKSLAELLSDQMTNSTTTLLNIQLNYILFTLEVDVAHFLDLAIKFILDSCQMYDSEHVEKYQRIYDGIVEDETKYDKACQAQSSTQKQSSKQCQQATLLCSLNRKTSEIQIHSTLQFLNFKNIPPNRSEPGEILSRRERGLFPPADDDQLINDFESFSSDDEDDLDDSSSRGTFSFRPIDERSTREDPYEHRMPTELYGTMKRDNRKNTFGGGHPTFGVV